MSVTQNVFTLKQAYDLIRSGQWADFSPLLDGSGGGFDPTALGKLYFAGAAYQGAMGLNDTIARSSPTQLPGCWRSPATTECNGAAIKSDGTLWAWGGNGYGQLGQGTCGGLVSSPIQIPGTNWLHVSARCSGFSAIKCDGTLWSWGSVSSGGLGLNNSIAPAASPTQIPGNQWCCVFTSGPRNSAAIKSDGTLWVWGSNNRGQLGIDNTIDKSSPTQIPGVWRWGTTGRCNGLFINNEYSMFTAGYGYYGSLGLGDAISRSSPTQVPGLWYKGVLGRFHQASLKTDGTLWTSGFNNSGQLGINNTTTIYRSPVQVPGTWIDISSSDGYFNIGRKVDGTAWTWGINSYGQLGDITTISKSSPVQILGTDYLQVYASLRNSSFLRSN